MERKEEFKVWLEQGGAQTEAGRNSRIYAVRTIERNLVALGMHHEDLEKAWHDDQFEALRERLKKMRSDARDGGQDYRILMPDSDKPHNRLSNWGSWLAQYGRYLAGDPPGAAKDADRIRQYVLEHFIEPAREEDRPQVDVLVRDVNTALGLKEAWPNICQALAGKIFQDMACISAPERIGANQSPATVFRFGTGKIETATSNRPFVLFDSSGAPFQPVRNFNRSTGESAFRIKPRGAGNTAAEAMEVEDVANVAKAMLVDGLASRVKAISGGPVNYLTFGGNKLVRYELDPQIATQIGVPPKGGAENEGYAEGSDLKQLEKTMETPATNLILYGPPGTGKTYTTAEEAVRLCGEQVPGNRDKLMELYHSLMASGRIEFVTFHQSMAYEEFVEGRQPMTGSDDGSDEGTTGFRLESVPGIFRRISKRAQAGMGKAKSGDQLTIVGRQVYKMSIGFSRGSDNDDLFEEAIDGGYTLLSWEDIDWSDAKYSSAEEILKSCEAEGEIEGPVSSSSGQVSITNAFRNRLNIGDVVVVSKGNPLVRAVGIVTGEYEYHPRPEGNYSHRREVKWLWHDTKGIPVDEVYDGNFTMRSLYQLKENRLNVAALERLMNFSNLLPEQEREAFVLIIDEINRANISKVFGELITLLEPDKRLGQENALTVRLPYSGENFGVPSNLHILGTMNTADRSIALLDTALRRRFSFREIMPEPSVLKGLAASCGIDVARLLGTINERIEYLYDREHQIGHAYFMGCKSKDDLDATMRHKVIPLLAEYFFEDWAKVAAVLGDLETHEGKILGGFLKREILKAPPGLDDQDTAPRYCWNLRSEVEGFDYGRLTAV